MDPVYLDHAEALSLSGAQLGALMDEVLARGLPFRFRAGGTSMLPLIRDDDILSIAPPGGRSPSVGEVAAYRAPCPGLPGRGQLIVHRVIRVNAQGCLLLGDNQLPGDADGPVPCECVLGTVQMIERGGRKTRLGLGPERRAIALLSRKGLLRPAARLAAAVYRIFHPNRAKPAHQQETNP